MNQFPIRNDPAERAPAELRPDIDGAVPEGDPVVQGNEGLQQGVVQLPDVRTGDNVTKTVGPPWFL